MCSTDSPEAKQQLQISKHEKIVLLIKLLLLYKKNDILVMCLAHNVQRVEALWVGSFVKKGWKRIRIKISLFNYTPVSICAVLILDTFIMFDYQKSNVIVLLYK